MAQKDWKSIFGNSISTRGELSGYFPLREEEKDWFRSEERGLPLFVNPYFLHHASTSEAMRKQCVPTGAERQRVAVETDDPLSEAIHSPLPRMVHRYTNRVAVLVTDLCAMNCRHCFRRSFTGQGNRPLSRDEIAAITGYLEEHTEVEEVLLTGGDPLTLEDALLLEVVHAFRSVREDLVLRLATRIPSVLPQRITRELAKALGKGFPLWVITQFNHPDELTDESRRALEILRKSGLPVMNQTVLLRGINDREEVLAGLFEGLLAQGVKPYYLFQGDLAAGTSHFRCNLERGWEIMRNLRTRISGLAMPVYAVDLPGGGGKVPLSESFLIGRNEEGFLFRNPEGKEYTYPDERQEPQKDKGTREGI